MKNIRDLLLIYVLGMAPVFAETPIATNVVPITLEDATKQVINSNYASRVLSAKTDEFEGRKVHVIKTLTLDGRIQQQTIDADTGNILDINDTKSEMIKE